MYVAINEIYTFLNKWKLGLQSLAAWEVESNNVQEYMSNIFIDYYRGQFLLLAALEMLDNINNPKTTNHIIEFKLNLKIDDHKQIIVYDIRCKTPLELAIQLYELSLQSLEKAINYNYKKYLFN